MWDWLFPKTKQIKVRITYKSGDTEIFWRDLEPPGVRDFDSVERDLKQSGKEYVGIKIWYP